MKVRKEGPFKYLRFRWNAVFTFGVTLRKWTGNTRCLIIRAGKSTWIIDLWRIK